MTKKETAAWNGERKRSDTIVPEYEDGYVYHEANNYLGVDD